MKYILPILFTLLKISFITGQQLTLETSLEASVNESSGLLYLNNTLITHNDSATTNQLFDINTSTGTISRTVSITNAINGDWEDLTHDDTYIYIGDFGNYQGDRTDLKVYRIAITDYFNTTSVSADVINFSYSNQTDFTPSPLATNFDAEGLIHYNNKLYVFSKNWLDGNTNIYELSKEPGTYSISMVDTLSINGLISGATYNTLDNSIMLCGYDINGAFLVQLSGFSSGMFSNGDIIKTAVGVPTNYSPQIEGIIPINTNEYFISSEENPPSLGGLYSFNTTALSINKYENASISFYPNPAKTSIFLSQENLRTKLYNTSGQFLMSSNAKEIDVSGLAKGVYTLVIKKNETQNPTIKKLIIK